MSKQVTVYSLTYCPFCVRAKRLLAERGIIFKEVVLSEDDDAQWDALEKQSGMKTAPQIFVTEGSTERCIGGFTELAALDQKDQLNSLR